MKMTKHLIILSFLTFNLMAFSQTNDCLKKMEYMFSKRGSNPIENGIHYHVIVSYTKPSGNVCYNGKVIVENSTITKIYTELEDGTFEELNKKFSNTKNEAPKFENGISDLIVTENGIKIHVIFVDKLKPKAKAYKEAELPEDI
jgi:hypothetical protein